MFNLFINKCVESGRTVKIIMVNGFQMSCKILSCDNECILVTCDGMKKLVFKHAVSTIEPGKIRLDKTE